MRAWNRFWFPQEGAGTLGFLRVLFFGGMLVCYRLFRAFPTKWGSVDAAFWQPSGLFAWLHLPLLSPSHIASLYWAWLVALFLACVGFFTRVATFLALVLGTYVLGLPYNFGWHSHFNIVVVFGMAVMACSRSGDAWSLDCALRAWRKGARSLTLLLGDRARSGAYAWPVRALWLVITLEYVNAGISKLAHSGLGWVTSPTLAISMTENAFAHPGFAPSSRFGLVLAQSPWMTELMAAMGLGLELAFPLALFYAGLRPVLVVSAIGFNTAIYLLMGPQFYELTYCNLILWIPWSAVGERLLRLAPSISPATATVEKSSPARKPHPRSRVS